MRIAAASEESVELAVAPAGANLLCMGPTGGLRHRLISSAPTGAAVEVHGIYGKRIPGWKSVYRVSLEA